MFPFWEVAVAPVLEAAEAHRIVEVGALRGENTRQIIDRLGPKTELHVVDPVPDFDPEEHEREFAGQYVFHRDLSLNVLGTLPPMDAALIDGDHNWYTVYNELRLLREVARAHDAPLPLMLLHDVGWPYGYRDLYYDPSNIPDEFRRDWRRAGMEPGKVRLVPFGAGLNPSLANAKVEGGPRNGVRKGMEDFVAEHDRPLRVVVLPIYFGLAIVAEQERLDRQPALAAELDRLESAAGKDQLLQLSEDIRLESLIFQHKIFYDRETSQDRLARRFLRELGAAVAGHATASAGLQDRLDVIRRDYVLGDIVSIGSTDPGRTVFAKGYVEAYELRNRHVWAVDPGGEEASPLKRALWSHDLLDATVQVLTPAAALAPDWQPEHVALVLVGGGAGAETAALLAATYERCSPGAYVVLDVDAGADVQATVAAWAAGCGAEPVETEGLTAWQKPGALPVEDRSDAAPEAAAP